MNSDLNHGMECSEFEALLAEALDDALTGDKRLAFDAHGRSCPVCGPLLSETMEGLVALRGLVEAEPPKNLMHNILAATSGKEVTAVKAGEAVKAGWLERLRRGLRPQIAGLMHSRFAASFAMAFFSLSITLTLAGVKISDVKNIDWHPSALRKSMVLGFTSVEAKVASYYENLRLVYQVQARVKEMKKNTTPAPENNNNNENRQQNRKSVPDDGGRPKQQENYSLERDGRLIAQIYTRNEGARI
jgi:hypothetical protein